MAKTIDSMLCMPADPKVRGLILKKRRKDLGLSQNDVAKMLAERLGVDKFDYKRISDWENGRLKNIPEDIKINLYLILNINEAQDIFMLKDRVQSDQENIYSKLAQELQKYVDNQINHYEYLTNDKVFTYETAFCFTTMVQEFLKDYSQRQK